MNATSQSASLKLGVNIDHVATLRQARYPGSLGHCSAYAEPSLLAAANEAETNGADSITVHLRQDRRHIQDRDVFELKEKIRVPLNLEMGDTPEILEIALRVKPCYACLVPENRREVTTEGGLNLHQCGASLRNTIERLRENGTRVSLFIDPEIEMVRAAAKSGAQMVELHTGSFANRFAEGSDRELKALVEAAKAAHGEGLQVNAGHGITLFNLPRLLTIPFLAELNVGHHLIARALFIGLGRSIREMKSLMEAYPAIPKS